jgi:hypothetical protein
VIFRRMGFHHSGICESTAAGPVATRDIVLALSVLVEGGGAGKAQAANAAEDLRLAGHRLGRVRGILMIVPPVHIGEGQTAEGARIGMVLTRVGAELALSKAVATLSADETFLFALCRALA